MSNIGKIRFPVIKNCEYIDLIKNKITVLSIIGKDVEGMKWREFQKYMGKKLPAQTYFYVIKLNDDNNIYKGQVKAIGTIVKPQSKPDPDYATLQKTVDGLNNKLNEASSNSGVSVDMLLEVTKSSYTLQIGFLNSEIQRKNSEIDKLQLNISELNDELDNADIEIEELKSKTGMNQYLEYAKQIIASKVATVKTSVNLEDSHLNEIPPEIVDLLLSIDWNVIPETQINEIVSSLKLFTQTLPMKGK